MGANKKLECKERVRAAGEGGLISGPKLPKGQEIIPDKTARTLRGKSGEKEERVPKRPLRGNGREPKGEGRDREVRTCKKTLRRVHEKPFIQKGEFFINKGARPQPCNKRTTLRTEKERGKKRSDQSPCSFKFLRQGGYEKGRQKWRRNVGGLGPQNKNK